MKDYSMGEGKKSYILRIEEDEINGTFNVIFTDGTVFRDIELNEENISKVISIQEQQAKIGVSNMSIFKNRRSKAGIMTGLSFMTSLATATACTTIPAVSNLVSGQNPLVVAAGIGTIAILGSIPALSKLVKESEKVTELEKIDYLNKNINILANYRQYHNALRGLSYESSIYFRRNSDPYCILDIDQFDKKDLEQIMENIRKEDTFAFTYKKVNSKKTK